MSEQPLSIITGWMAADATDRGGLLLLVLGLIHKDLQLLGIRVGSDEEELLKTLLDSKSNIVAKDLLKISKLLEN